MTERWLLIDDLRELNCDETARTGEEGVELLKTQSWDVLCLDHDLGDSNAMSGYDVLMWAIENDRVPLRVQLVTSNPVGRNNMRAALESVGYITTDGINFIK